LFLRIVTVLSTLAFIASADTLTLRNGTTLRGQYLGGDSRHIRMDTGDRVETVNVDEISTLEFGRGESSRRETYRERDNDALPTAPPPEPNRDRDYSRPPRYSSVPEIPSGTQIVVRMIDDVDSERDRTGKDFKASVDEPVLVNGQVLIPRGADVVARLVEDRQSGKFEGRTVLTMDLVQVQVNGRMVDINTTDVTQSSSSRGARTGKVVGGTTVLGAIVGAIAGGGKGAAIGAASGAAVGGGVQVFTKGQRVRIPSETRLSFTLQQATPLQ
jgi:hypothetical protein